MSSVKLTKENAQVGLGVTIHYYTDSRPYTIAKIRGSHIYIKSDKVTRLTKPEIIPGGFSGVCVNNHQIKYEITEDPQCTNLTVLCPKRNGEYHYNGRPVTVGRQYFYDYNF